MFKKTFLSMVAVLFVFMSGTAFAKEAGLPVIEGPDIVCVPIGADTIEILEKYYKAIDIDGTDITDEMYVFIDEFETDKPGMYKAILAVEYGDGEDDIVQRMIDIVVGCPELPTRN
ncbi:hypothetical protein NSQ26_05980 [Bacillus sp. FSL W7-1360]